VRATLTTDRTAGVALVVVGVIAMWESRRFPLGSLRHPGPAYMPVVLALLLIAFGVALVVMSGRSGRFTDVGWSEWRHAVAIFGACAFAAWAMERLGYQLTMAAVLAFLLGVLERRNVIGTLILTVAIAAGSFYLFNNVLKVPLPRGPFGL
jgi:uncharacterized membrane protein